MILIIITIIIYTFFKFNNIKRLLVAYKKITILGILRTFIYVKENFNFQANYKYTHSLQPLEICLLSFVKKLNNNCKKITLHI